MNPIWVQILIAGVHTFLVLLVILWRVPTKEDVDRQFERLENKIDNLDQRLFDHISNHPKT